MYCSRLSDVRVYLNSGDSCGIPLASAIHNLFFWESVYPDCLKDLSLRRIIPASVHHLSYRSVVLHFDEHSRNVSIVRFLPSSSPDRWDASFLVCMYSVRFGLRTLTDILLGKWFCMLPQSLYSSQDFLRDIQNNLRQDILSIWTDHSVGAFVRVLFHFSL